MSSRFSFAPAILGKAAALAASVLRFRSLAGPAETLATSNKPVGPTCGDPHAHPCGISINHLPGPAELAVTDDDTE
jgi:hypothetical protein